jgi:NAD(P)-dependent dehydrogenase (short-subunit alcohol dehydrogenase family)
MRQAHGVLPRPKGHWPPKQQPGQAYSDRRANLGSSLIVTFLASLPRPCRAAVVGASGGIGAGIAEALAVGGIEVHALSRRPVTPQSGLLDLTDEASIAAACEALAGDPPLRLAIVATGLLHDGTLRPEKSLAALDAERLARSFAVNTIGPALVAKHVLPLLPREGKSVFAVLSARVGSIADNRLGGWYGYRASKAALNQIVRTLAIEIRRTRPEAIVVALHPGTVETPLSAPFRGGVSAERLFAPEVAADHLLRVVDGLHAENSGGFFAWDGKPIPF